MVMAKRSIDQTWEELGLILRRSYQTHQVGFALYLVGNTHFLPLLYTLRHVCSLFAPSDLVWHAHDAVTDSLMLCDITATREKKAHNCAATVPQLPESPMTVSKIGIKCCGLGIPLDLSLDPGRGAALL